MDSRSRRAKLDEMTLKEAQRKDELAKLARDAVAQVPTRAAMKGLTPVPEHQGEAYDEEYRPAQVGVDSPEGPDFAAKARAEMEARLKAGDLEGAEKTRKLLGSLETEGYNKIITGVADGRSVQEIAREFNAIGSKRIVGGSSDGKVYRLKYEDGTEAEYSRDDMTSLAAAHKLRAKPEEKIVAPGYALARDGKEVYRNTGTPASVQAASVRASVPRPPPKAAAVKPPNFNAADAELRRLATAHYTTSNPDTGAKIVDNESKEETIAEAGKLLRADPTMPPAAAFRTAAEQVGERKQTITQAQAEAETAAAGLDFENDAKRQEWIKSTARATARRRMKLAGATPATPAADAKPPGAMPTPATEQAAKEVKPTVNWRGSTMTFTGKYARNGKPIYANDKGEQFTMEK
jgi:hypothetical protein